MGVILKIAPRETTLDVASRYLCLTATRERRLVEQVELTEAQIDLGR